MYRLMTIYRGRALNKNYYYSTIEYFIIYGAL